MAAAAPLVLVSHALCPYVQRAAIVLAEKGLPFERRDVDLSAKPDWFLAVSPLGKTPVLLAEGEALFESAVICEYLDETALPRLHPAGALARARHRAWIEFGSQLLAAVAALYNALDDDALESRTRDLRSRLERLEDELAGSDGPFFGGAGFSLVDAAIAPVFRYFDAFEAAGIDPGAGLPRLQAWRQALMRRPSVRDAVSPAYPALLQRFLRSRGSALSRRMSAQAGAAA